MTEYTYTFSPEPWGMADFELFYSQSQESLMDKIKNELYLTEEERLEYDNEVSNLVDFETKYRTNPPVTIKLFSDKSLKPEEQIFVNYGRCNNRIFIIQFGFALWDNEYDGFTVHVKTGDNSRKSVILRKCET